MYSNRIGSINHDLPNEMNFDESTYDNTASSASALQKATNLSNQKLKKLAMMTSSQSS